jgi:hypothetical protein
MRSHPRSPDTQWTQGGVCVSVPFPTCTSMICSVQKEEGHPNDHRGNVSRQTARLSSPLQSSTEVQLGPE